MTTQHHPQRLSGVWLPLVTPFHEGELDLQSFDRMLAHYLALPIDGLIVAATTAEGLALTDEETAALVDLAARRAAGRIPVHLGLSGSWTAKLEKAIATAERWPADGYLIACPYYTRPSQDGLHDHFAALGARTARPIVIYNIPYRTGVNLANDTLLRLAALSNIVGLKDCCADLAQSFDLLRRRPEDFAVLTGEDGQLFQALAQGADGAILASAHLRTDEFAALTAALRAGERGEALRLWPGLLDLVRLLFSEPSPAPIKHCLWRQGLLRSPELRLPMTGVSPALAAALDAEIGV